MVLPPHALSHIKQKLLLKVGALVQSYVSIPVLDNVLLIELFVVDFPTSCLKNLALL